MNTTVKKEITRDQKFVDVINKLNTMSSKIRYLDSQKMSRGDISRFLDIRYQWVRNVLITPVKKQK